MALQHVEDTRTDDDDSATDALSEAVAIGKECGDDDPPSTTSVFWTTVVLCVCMLTQSYLLISVFPYSGFLALDLVTENGAAITEDDAAQYAGLIASAFMVGRATTSILWGRAADRYGRTVALYASLILSGLCCLWFGITRTFAAALSVRFLLGCSNGIMSTIKTVVSEITTNERTEARIMSLVMGMWGWGFLISPVFSGALSEPVKQYPGAGWLDEGTLAGKFLREYPFFLPNLLGAAICLVAIALTRFFVHETLPADQIHSVTGDLRRLLRRCRSCLPSYRYESLPRRNSQLSDRDMTVEKEDDLTAISRETLSSPSMIAMLSQVDTRNCLLLYWLYSFVSLTVDESFPLFCLSHTTGFGIPEKEIGKILSCTGLIFALSQYCVYTCVYNHCGGLLGSIKVGTASSAPLMFLMPLSLLLNRGAETLRWSTFFFLAVLLAVHRCFALVFFSSISVATNRTVPASNRGAVNGLSVLGGSVAKSLGPAFAGLLTTLSASWLGRYASLVIFGSIGLLGLGVTWGTLVLLPKVVASNVVDEEKEPVGIVPLAELEDEPAAPTHACR